MKKKSSHFIRQIKNEIRGYVCNNGLPRERKLLESAFSDIASQYKGEYRYSGEPVVRHSLNVGRLLCQFKAEMPTIIAGLLHDLLEDTETTRLELADKYGTWYADMVEALSKTKSLLATHQKLLQAGQHDIRCLIIKIYDRLDNIRDLQWLPIHKRKRISHETLSFYVPIAEKIGVSSFIVDELKDRSLTFI